MTKLWIDLETYSETPIAHGTFRYAEDSEIMLAAYAWDDDPPQLVDFTKGERFPRDVLDFLKHGRGEVWAHNAMFDATVLWCNGVNSHIGCWRDTMIQALAHSLPGGLAALCQVLGLPQELWKQSEGKKLIQLFCKPRPKNSALRRATHETHPDPWGQFCSYAKMDIVATRAVHRAMPRTNYPDGPELTRWHLDQVINARGFCVDTELVEAAIKLVGEEQARLKAETQESTDDQLGSTSQNAQMLKYILEAHNVSLPDLQKSTLQRRMDDEELPGEVRELIRIRLQASATSTTKYKALANAVNSDGRCRGTIQHLGAARTGRAAGRTFQPQNLPSRGLLSKAETAFGVEAIKGGFAPLVYPNIMKLLTSTVRGVLIAPPGKKLVIADLANIEGRMLAWLAGEESKLQAFRDFDAKVGEDLYVLAYAGSFNVPVASVTSAQRSIGKVQELMLGYSGGVKAFLTGAMGYGFDLEELGANIWDTLPEETVQESLSFYDWAMAKGFPNLGLSKRAYVACDVLKRLWRAANPNIVQFWGEVDSAVRSAIAHPDEVFAAGEHVKVKRSGNWLGIRLPSGRVLFYPAPKIVDGEITFLGNNVYTRKWERCRTYSGKLVENCVAEGTLVVTERGALPIEQVTGERVWDGEEWVSHAGLVYNGKQVVCNNFGVYTTPDHLILTEAGWRNASQSEGYNRAACRLPHGYEVRGHRREAFSVGSVVCMRKDHGAPRVRTPEAKETRHKVVMRVHEAALDRGRPKDPRYVKTPCVRGMALYERPLPATVASSVQELWRAGYQSLRAVGLFVSKLLGGYGARVPEGLRLGAAGQFSGIHSRKLRMGNPPEEYQQSAEERAHRDPERRDDDIGGGGLLQYRALDARLACEERVGHRARVYDLVDCGPRNRFTVIGDDGLPLIVHNCTQAASRDVLYSGMPGAEAAGYEIVLHVHDELVTEVPDAPEFSVDDLCKIMTEPFPGFEGLPLSAAGFEAYRYRK